MAARWRGGQEYTGWRERARGPSDGEYLAMQCQGARECQGERHFPGRWQKRVPSKSGWVTSLHSDKTAPMGIGA